MLSSKCFSVNPKKTACGVKSYQQRCFFKKNRLNYSITLLQQSNDKKDAQLFCYFGHIKSIENGQIYQMNRAFHLNKAHCLKSYIGSSVYKDDKLQCVEEYKYTSNQVRSR